MMASGNTEFEDNLVVLAGYPKGFPFEAMNPVHPADVKVVKEGLEELVREWDSVLASVGASVRASVGDSVGASVWDSVVASFWDSVGDSIWDSVGDSAYAYIGSMFPQIKEWKYYKGKLKGYPYRSGAELWRRGVIPVKMDGHTWRVYHPHRKRKATLVMEVKV